MENDVVKNYSLISGSVEGPINKRGEITNRRGNVVVPRKYHMTEPQIELFRERWKNNVKDTPKEIRKSVSSLFFNPYRENGAYYGGVQALFLLGGNKWHSYSEVRDMMQKDMVTRKSNVGNKNSWEKFALKGAREGAILTKDLMGRIVHNFRTLQRLGGIHPYGYKLKQSMSAIDIKREADGIYYFRLNTSFKETVEVLPYYNVNSFKKPRKARKLKIVPTPKEDVVIVPVDCSDKAVSSD
jgi:hypothetical protein